MPDWGSTFLAFPAELEVAHSVCAGSHGASFNEGAYVMDHGLLYHLLIRVIHAHGQSHLDSVLKYRV